MTGAQFEYSPQYQLFDLWRGGGLGYVPSGNGMGEQEAAEAGAHGTLSKGEQAGDEGLSSSKRKWLDSAIPAIVVLIGAGCLALTIDFSGPGASMGFFGVGALLLTGEFYASGTVGVLCVQSRNMEKCNGLEPEERGSPHWPKHGHGGGDVSRLLPCSKHGGLPQSASRFFA